MSIAVWTKSNILHISFRSCNMRRDNQGHTTTAVRTAVSGWATAAAAASMGSWCAVASIRVVYGICTELSDHWPYIALRAFDGVICGQNRTVNVHTLYANIWARLFVVAQTSPIEVVTTPVPSSVIPHVNNAGGQFVSSFLRASSSWRRVWKKGQIFVGVPPDLRVNGGLHHSF